MQVKRENLPEPEMGFEPMTCALRGPSKASSWVLLGRNVSYKGRSTGVKLETVAIRCNSLRRLKTQIVGTGFLFLDRSEMPPTADEAGDVPVPQAPGPGGTLQRHSRFGRVRECALYERVCADRRRLRR